MTSDRPPREAFVWIWLPGAAEPVVAGRLVMGDDGVLTFGYGRSYLGRAEAIPIYAPELPLRRGEQRPGGFMIMPSSIRDAAPDAWGRRVIINRLTGLKGNAADAALDELTFLLESGSDRIGALDFQGSATEYVPRLAANATLDELEEAIERVEAGEPLSPALELAINHGTSIGGARPKALVDGEGTKHIAKFSASNDTYSVVKAEFIAMRLAKLAGLDVPPVRLTRAARKDVLLIERFDRVRAEGRWRRNAIVSALTLQNLDEMMARYASYEALADMISRRFDKPAATRRELFARIVFNILVGNTDDHARNHAAFWDGERLALTPAYDICPQPRTGREASQAMHIAGDDRSSRIASGLAAAAVFGLSMAEAVRVVEGQLETIQLRWREVCEEAELTGIDRRLLWGRQFLNPYAFDDLAGPGEALRRLADDIRVIGE
jgi:serine/threonine-protein kinase HipA